MYPRLIETTGRSPPEDSVTRTATRSSSRQSRTHSTSATAEMREWCGEDFDPNALDTEGHASALAALAALARQWARKPAVKRKRATDPRS